MPHALKTPADLLDAVTECLYERGQGLRGEEAMRNRPHHPFAVFSYGCEQRSEALHKTLLASLRECWGAVVERCPSYCVEEPCEEGRGDIVRLRRIRCGGEDSISDEEGAIEQAAVVFSTGLKDDFGELLHSEGYFKDLHTLSLFFVFDATETDSAQFERWYRSVAVIKRELPGFTIKTMLMVLLDESPSHVHNTRRLRRSIHDLLVPVSTGKEEEALPYGQNHLYDSLFIITTAKRDGGLLDWSRSGNGSLLKTRRLFADIILLANSVFDGFRGPEYFYAKPTERDSFYSVAYSLAEKPLKDIAITIIKALLNVCEGRIQREQQVSQSELSDTLKEALGASVGQAFESYCRPKLPGSECLRYLPCLDPSDEQKEFENSSYDRLNRATGGCWEAFVQSSVLGAIDTRLDTAIEQNEFCARIREHLCERIRFPQLLSLPQDALDATLAQLAKAYEDAIAGTARAWESACARAQKQSFGLAQASIEELLQALREDARLSRETFRKIKTHFDGLWVSDEGESQNVAEYYTDLVKDFIRHTEVYDEANRGLISVGADRSSMLESLRLMALRFVESRPEFSESFEEELTRRITMLHGSNIETILHNVLTQDLPEELAIRVSHATDHQDQHFYLLDASSALWNTLQAPGAVHPYGEPVFFASHRRDCVETLLIYTFSEAFNRSALDLPDGS